MRFAQDSDYYAAMGRFSEVNAPVTQAGTFPTHKPPPRPFSSSSSLLQPSDSISQVNTRPTSKSSALASDHSGAESSSRMLNAAENFLRPSTSSSSIQLPTPDARRPATAINQTYDFQNRRDTYALPHDHVDSPHVRRLATTLNQAYQLQDRSDICAFPQDHVDSPHHPPRSTPTTSQYWSEGTDVNTPFKRQTDLYELYNFRAAPATAWSTSAASPSQPKINLYEPRPSTAPIEESQHLTDMLPPKRDLPFAIPVSKDGSASSKKMKSSVKNSPPTNDPKEKGRIASASVNDFRSVASQSSQLQELETQSAPTATAKAKRTPAKRTSTQGAKKPTASSSRKKLASKEQETLVPSIEALLKRSENSAKNVAPMSKSIDTQILLAQVEQRQEAATAQTFVDESRPGIQPHSKAVSTPQRAEELLPIQHPIRPMFEEPALQAEVVSSATQILDSQEGVQNQLQSMPTTGQGNGTSLAFDNPAPLFQPPTELDSDNKAQHHSLPSPRQPLAERNQNIIVQQQCPSLMFAAEKTRTETLVHPLADLLQDPNFARSPDLAGWAKQSEDARHASLETFICQTIRDPGFFELCKELDGTWQGVFLGKTI